jgi:hypothetical protein
MPTELVARWYPWLTSLWTYASEGILGRSRRRTLRRGLAFVLASLLVGITASRAAPMISTNTDADSGPVPICNGDCNGDGIVTIEEIILIVNIILGNDAIMCADIFPERGIDAVILAVNSSLRGCEMFTYHLVPPSSIVLSASRQDGTSIVEEPLSGSFTAVPSASPRGGANSIFYFRLTNLRFQSDSSTVSGERGEIATFTLSPEGTVATIASVSIDGLGLDLCGVTTFAVFRVPYPPGEYPPTFDGLEVCATPGDPSLCQIPMCEEIRTGSRSGYALTLFAVPDS